MRLSILCVTRADAYVWPFLAAMAVLGRRLDAEVVFAADGPTAQRRLRARTPVVPFRVVPVTSAGFLESVLDEAVAACTGDYVLRLDDDERCSPAMVAWLEAGQYQRSPHWSIPRANLWTPTEAIVNPPLWPNRHERLSVRPMAAGRATRPHARSPYGRGTPAPVCFEHHKFLVKSYADRVATAARYDAVAPGLGTGHDRPYSLPEDVYTTLLLAPLGSGTVLEIDAARRRHVLVDAEVSS